MNPHKPGPETLMSQAKHRKKQKSKQLKRFISFQRAPINFAFYIWKMGTDNGAMRAEFVVRRQDDAFLILHLKWKTYQKKKDTSCSFTA